MKDALQHSFACAKDEARDFGKRSPEAHFEALRQAITLSLAFLEGNPRAAELLEQQDPVPPAYRAQITALWKARHP